MSKKRVFKRTALVVAAALAIGGFTAISAQAVGVTTPTAATQTLGAITRTSLNTWTEPVTITMTGTGFAAGQTVTVAEAATGTSTATNAVPTYTLLAGDVASPTSAAFTTAITYTATSATNAGETAALGTQILTPTIGGFVGAVSPAVTIPGNPNLQATVGSSYNGSTATQIAGPANSVMISNFNATNPVYYTLSGGLNTTGTASGTVAPSGTFNVATPAIGTIVVTGYVITSGATSTTATDTVTITVVGALPGTAYSAATVLGAPGVTAPTTVTDSAFTVNAPAALPAATVANFTLVENDANGLSLSSGFKALAITSSLGTISVGGAGFGTVVAAGGYASGTPTGAMTFALANNGQAGVATVAVSVNGVATKSYSVTFSGPATKIVLIAVNNVVAIGNAATLLAATSSITANTNALKIQEFDAAGNLLPINTASITVTPSAAVTATASTPSVAVGVAPFNFLGGMVSGTALSSTVAGVSVNGVAVGTLTFTAPISDGTVTISAVPASASIVIRPATFAVASNTSAGIKEATDAAKAAVAAATAAGLSADLATAAAKAAGVQATAAVAAVAALNVLVMAALKNLKSLIALIARVVRKVKA